MSAVVPVKVFPKTMTLDDEEYAAATKCGLGRGNANNGRGNAFHYAKIAERGGLQPSEVADVAAAVAELAVAKCVNRTWHAGVWTVADHHLYAKDADVGTNIEVKRIRSMRSGGVARTNHENQDLVLFVVYVEASNLRTARILGWLPHNVGLEIGSQPTDIDGNPDTSRYRDRVFTKDHLITSLPESWEGMDPTQTPLALAWAKAPLMHARVSARRALRNAVSPALPVAFDTSVRAALEGVT